MEKEHTVKSYDAELNAIRGRILEMGNRVQEMISQVMTALVERRSDLAEEVITADEFVNELEVEIDEKSQELIARRRPRPGTCALLSWP